jgi:hypothetical protein
MFQRARKFEELAANPPGMLELGELQREAYVVAMNSLSMLESNDAYLVLPVTSSTSDEVSFGWPIRPAHAHPSQPTKRRKLSKYIPASKFAVGKRDAEMVRMSDMQREYALVTARLDLLRKDPNLLAAGG